MARVRIPQIWWTLKDAPPAMDQLGLHVTTDELAIWRARATGGPYRVAGDAQTNSPGDWSRIVQFKNAYDAGSITNWLGPTFEWTSDTNYTQVRSISSGWNNTTPAGKPGTKDNNYSSAPVMCAAFYAMVAGSDHVTTPAKLITNTVRDALLTKVKNTLLACAGSKYLTWQWNAGGNFRWPQNGFGNGHEPIYPIGRWLVKMAHAYDYAQIANPAIWSTAEREEFIAWLCNAANIFKGMYNQRSLDEFNFQTWNDTATGVSAVGDAPWAGGSLVQGGPAEEHVAHHFDNHSSSYDRVSLLGALLAELEDVRDASFTSPITPTRITELKNHAKLVIRSYLAGEFIPSVSAFGGGVRWASGNMFRTDEVSAGWKYSGEHLAHVVSLADWLARSGDTYGYTFQTTEGSSLSAGSTLNQPPITNGKPKSLRRAMQSWASYVVENTVTGVPFRYKNGTAESNRIDSRPPDQNARANEWEMLHGNVYFRDSYFQSIYRRTRAGCPALPANPQNAQHLVAMGDFGCFPGANFMFAQMEGKVWPYPGSGPADDA